MTVEPDRLGPVFTAIFAERDTNVRQGMVDDVLREHHTVFTRLARELVNRFNIGPDWVDDVRQIVRMEAWKYLMADLKPGFDVSATLPCIRRAARSEVQRMRQSTAYTGVSGMVTARRRESGLARHRVQLIRTLGYEPDDRELIESYNASLVAARGEERARHQGALATAEDLHPPRMTELDDGSHVASSSQMESEAEVRSLVAEIVRRCRAESAQAGQVAEVVLGTHLDTSPGEAEWTASAVVKHVDMSTSQVARTLQVVRAVAVEVVDEWGLDQT